MHMLLISFEEKMSKNIGFLALTTDACKKGNSLGMHFQIIDFFYDW